MRQINPLLVVFVLAIASLTLADDDATQDVTFGAAPEPATPPIRMPVEPGPFSQSQLQFPDGRIAISGMLTITQPGSYVVTRNIGCPSQWGGGTPTITVEASQVDIDLNGFTLCAGEPVIAAENVRGIRIYNGGIASYEEAIALTDVSQFAIHDLLISGWEDHCMVGLSGTEGVFESNVLYGDRGTLCVSGNQMVVRDNRISRTAGQNGGDISVGACDGCQVLHNTAVSIATFTTGGTVASNNISESLTVGGSDNLILDNVVSHGNGAEIAGDRNHIEGNLFSANVGYGLKISGNDCVVRRNTVRGNNGIGCAGTASGGDFCDEGTNNTSHGDNYMPAQM